MSDQTQEASRAQLLEVLMEKVSSDAYPSSTMLNMIEELLTDEDIPEYVDLLLDRIRADQFPSIPMLARVRRFA